MMGQLVARGHELTPHPDQAEVLVVNTCSFIDPAKQESVDTILEMAGIQEDRPRQEADRGRMPGGALSRRHPPGTSRKSMPSSAPTNSTPSWPVAKGCVPTPAPSAPYLYHDLTPRVLATPRHFAYVKIAEGCDHPCAFCVIPQYRGKFRSRRFESVVAEATRLFSAGRAGNQPDRPGHHRLWRRPGHPGRAGAAAGAPGANRDGAREVDPVPVRVSQQGDAEAAGHHRGARCVGEIHRHAAAARRARRC